MKKSIKRTAAAVLAVATTAGIAGTTSLSLTKTNLDNNVSVYAETAEEAAARAKRNTLNVSAYKKVVNLYDKFTLPTVTFVNDSGVSESVTQFKVTTSTGKTFDQTSDKIQDGQFEVDEIGKYTIEYVSGNYKGEISFTVESVSYNISLAENQTNILPNKLSMTNKDGSTFTKEFNVPSYNITKKDGSELKDSERESLQVKIFVTRPDFKTVEITDGKLVFDETDENKIQEGNYIVTYKVYNQTTGEFICQTSTEFRAVKDNYENEFELTLVYSGADVPTSVNLGKTIELPGITAKNGTEVVSSYYTVKAYRIKSENKTEILEGTVIEGTDTKILSKENGVYKFTADDLASNYRFEYEVFDALGNKQTIQFNITSVVDSLDPTPIVVDAYTVTDGVVQNKDNIVKKDYDLKSVFDAESENVVIKAIYAEDLGTFKYSDFKFKRIIRSSGTTIFEDSNFEHACKNIVFNNTEKAGTEDDENVYSDKKLENGVYTVSYVVTDANGRSKSLGYEFEISNNVDWSKPTVTFNDTFYSNIDLGETIEFGKVSFSDEKDERLDTAVYYTYTAVGPNGEKVDGDIESEKIKLSLNSSNKYVIDTSDREQVPANAKKITIYAIAKNDGGMATTEKREILINNQGSGVSVPTICDIEDADYSYSYKQNQIITLPTMRFQDGSDGVGSLNARVTIKHSDGTEVPATGAYVIKIGDYFVYSGTQFVASKKGSYQVSIKVYDPDGNAVVKFLNYQVESADYVGELRFANMQNNEIESLELGDKYKLYEAEITGDDAEQYDWNVRAITASGDYELSKKEFKPFAVGEYEIQYFMYKKSDNSIVEDKFVTVKFNVSDTKAPEINVNWETSAIKLPSATETDKTKQGIAPAYEQDTTILIPMFSVSDVSDIDEEKSTIVIKTNGSKDSETKTIKFSEMVEKYNAGLEGTTTNNSLFHKFKYNAEYNIIYTAYDKAGNSTSKTYTIKIGDLVKPTLTVSDSIVKSSYNAGETLTINVADINGENSLITAKDNKSTFEGKDVKVELTLNGNKIDNINTGDDKETKYIFKLEDAGEYSLTFKVTDGANNVSEITKTFTIQDAETEAKTSTEIIGIVLIVVSVVVLAGVVVYFVISKKKMDKLYKG